MPKLYLRNGMYYSNFRDRGKRVRKALSPYKRVAQQMLDDMVLLVRAQKNGIVPRDIRWSVFEARYLEFSATDKKKNTVYRDKSALKALEDAGHIEKLSDVTPERLEHLKFRWKEKGVPEPTITRRIKAIKTAMRKAEEWGYIGKQEWRSVKVKEPKGRLLYYSVPELKRLITASRGIYRTTIILMSRCGLRSGEVYHLDWSDIDLDRSQIHVRPKPCQMKCPGCESGYWQPKWSKDRIVPMGPDVKDYLSPLETTGPLLKGRPQLQPFGKHLVRIIETVKLAGSAHTLRHTFASHAVSNGVSLEAVGAILGHSDPRTTKIYAHLMPHVYQQAVAALPVVRLGYKVGNKKQQRILQETTEHRRENSILAKVRRPEASRR